MIEKFVDYLVATVSPVSQIRRSQARKILKRSYNGAEPSRLNSNRNPMNRSADQELDGPFGADTMRAWARMLVRDNAYAWGVVDTIVQSVVGHGIHTQSNLSGANEINQQRDDLFEEWAKVCDINGVLDWHSIQALIQREIVEAGEVLVHMVSVNTTDRGIVRPVPFALELIEADRLAVERSTLRVPEGENRIIRGVEVDHLGKPVAYHVHKNHPGDFHVARDIVRLPASNVLHLFRKDRVGQTRGISWFAPVISQLRDLGVYIENEMVASAIASCYTAAIKSKSPVSMLSEGLGEDTSDANGNAYDFMQPGLIMHLAPDEDISFGAPGRASGDAEVWINTIVRGIAVGTGLSFETVARDYSKTNWSSNRASQLEDRRRFRSWQMYLQHNLCDPVWSRFCQAASIQGNSAFPSLSELLADKTLIPNQHLATGWEWVDPQKEGQASAEAIANNLSTLQYELGKKGLNWRKVLAQREKEVEFTDALFGVVPNGAEQLVSEEPSSDEQVPENEANNNENTDDSVQVDEAQDAGIVADTTLNGAQINAAVEVLEKLQLQTIAPTAAIELLVAVGIPRDQVELMVNSQVDQAKPAPVAEQQITEPEVTVG